MKQIHDIFVRAYVVPSEQEKDKQHQPNRTNGGGKWLVYMLAFDTETRITADQSLTFGVFRVGQLQCDKYVAIREGISMIIRITHVEYQHRVFKDWYLPTLNSYKSMPVAQRLARSVQHLRERATPVLPARI